MQSYAEKELQLQDQITRAESETALAEEESVKTAAALEKQAEEVARLKKSLQEQQSARLAAEKSLAEERAEIQAAQLVKLVKEQPKKALEQSYKWKTDHSFNDGGTQKIEIIGRSNGIGIKFLEGGVVLFIGNESIIDGPGARDVHIRIDPVTKSTMYAGLKFTSPCVVAIHKDFTLSADKEGIIAKDQKGQSWKSMKVALDEEIVNVFLPLP